MYNSVTPRSKNTAIYGMKRSRESGKVKVELTEIEKDNSTMEGRILSLLPLKYAPLSLPKDMLPYAVSGVAKSLGLDFDRIGY